MDVEEVVIEENYYECTRTDSPPDAASRIRRCLDGSWDDDDQSLQDCDDEFDWDLLSCEDEGTSGHNRDIGQRGEAAAARYLEHVGFEILERNWKCPAGEADIIAYDEDTLVFVEVKTRVGISKGFPSEAVDAKKRARYEKIAMWYLRKHDAVDMRVRFDVIATVVVARGRAFLKHYANAFGTGL